MFDIGFWELGVIAVMGLIVLGPERLPGALRTVISWVRSVRSMATNVKEEISQELHIHELQQNLKKAEQQGMADLAPDLQRSVDELKDAAASVQRPYQDDSPSSTNRTNQATPIDVTKRDQSNDG
ncbi:Sec-independent protein translocase protein TatB [Neiella marina]|uniref:Sec-independent protein translocase protein TatB n=1 Tax=Neiella holothuriorum TaxID=2870530 RepID=A0ABS7EC75_9GAMM|nr:Sec-independent protein translocase protein TatB [Neiella holothuriorum]MBW8189936.1 Sec-independent protein translocase protein TatB [Neiella holothuriorum]